MPSPETTLFQEPIAKLFQELVKAELRIYASVG